MTRRELANALCRAVTRRRLDRIGNHDTLIESDPVDGLPEEEQRNWLDMADAVMSLKGEHRPPQRLRDLADDWDHYILTIVDKVTRDEMCRAVVVEMRVEVEKLWVEVTDR